jgi:DNA-binding CsgD family transcriptional regulator
MPDTRVKVAVGGGHELDRAARSALISRLPGLRVVDTDEQPQVLVWQIQEIDELPSIGASTALLLIIDRLELEGLPDTVTGLFSLDESPAALAIAIRQVARGEQYLSPSLALAILEKHKERAASIDADKTKIDALSEREREILNLLAQGLSNKMIAARLYLSVRTVEGHLANIYSHLSVHSRTEAMLMAVKVR